MFRKLFLAALVTLFAACARTEAPVRPSCPAGKVCLHRGNTSEPVSLDPHRTSGTWENRIISDMIQGLFDLDPDGRPVPAMAESWTTSPDGLTWTFRLRDTVWSDGVPVTAEDFVYAYRRILKPETASQYSFLLYALVNGQAINEGRAAPETLGARALDARTLQLTLNNPAPYLPELTTHYSFYPLPRHVVEAKGAAWIRPGNYVSNGPYILADWRQGDRVRTVRNPRFWDNANVCYDEVYFYPTVDAISAERRVLRGELDLNSDVRSNRIAYLRGRAESRDYVRTHTWLGTAYLAFNAGPRSHAPALKDRRVRRALSMAIDREFIANQLLRGGQIPAYGLVPPGMANYVSDLPRVDFADWPLARRQREARRLLAEAGFGPGNPLRLEIKHRNSDDPSLFMPAIQADWAAVGVQATLAKNDVQIAYQSYRIRDFDVADASWIADFNDAKSFLDLQQSQTGQQNYGDYANPRYDALLAAADRAPDAAARARLMAQAEQMMLEDAPIAPLYHLVNKNLVGPAVDGWRDNIVDQHRTRWLCPRGGRAASAR